MAEVIPVRVALRIRPISKKEIEDGCDQILDMVPGRPQVLLKNNQKSFTYDFAFPSSSEQGQIYEKSVQPLIEKLFKGYNATVLAYGQTGSGKTYTMGTNNEIPEGVIPRAVRTIFNKIAVLKDQYDFSVRVAFVELYNEKLYDLLSQRSKIKEECIVDLREDPSKGVVISNLTEVSVETLETTMEKLEQGSIKRVTAATAMNNVSSRSHAIFTVFVEGTLKQEMEDMDNIFAKFHLVDLAGSERAKKTQATGNRFKEGVNINLGLLALGNVIHALGDDCGPKSHIPYRDSKLTRLLQDSLGGNSHTLMIACVSPADTNFDETVSTLRYADRARKIKNKPIVNQDGKDAEIAKLKREVADMKLRLLNSGSSDHSSISKELEHIRSKNSQLTSENRELTTGLMNCQDELSHMNEKLLLTDDSAIKLKTKLAELAAFVESLINKTPMKMDIENIFKKINNLMSMQKDAEKSLIEHDRSRFNETTHNDTTKSLDTTEEYGTAEILKQNALASQLATLNKQLAQKEQYAENLSEQEDKLRAIRNEYENKMTEMETQMKTLVTEKDQLLKQNRTEPASSKIAEQRRKRIQELETSMADLRKKLLEQQRMIKMNEKNEQKLKQSQVEIRDMKQAKVRLIRQMKEEAEKVRTWKMQKEKEVNKLKQSEQKQQSQMAKMTNLHSKQQNVLRRKMEDANMQIKRLKDVLDKQKANKKDKVLGKQGLAGAAERMRNLVSQELDVVVSVKEAKLSREQLLKDRTTMSKQLADMKRKQRVTMTSTEREEMNKKITELEEEMTLRNAQISELQKQIYDIDATNEHDNNQHKIGTAKWYDSLASMTEAKIALQYLFEKAAENMATLSTVKGNAYEQKTMYDEAVKNIESLEDEIDGLKNEHEHKMVEAAQEYEERVTLLLKQLTGRINNSNVGTSSLEDSMKDSDLQKFSELQEALLRMKEDFEANQKSKANNPRKKSKTSNEDRYDDLEEFLKDHVSDLSEDDEEESDDEREWFQTPLIRRIKKIRETNLHNTKRKLGTTLDVGSDEGPPKPKRSNSSTSLGCSCKTGCNSKRCSCVKGSKGCTSACKCPSDQCVNKGQEKLDSSSEGQDERSVLCDKTNNLSSANSTENNTMALLNDTYQIPDTMHRKITPPSITVENFDENLISPKKKPRMSLFKSPQTPLPLQPSQFGNQGHIMEETTPPSVKMRQTFFKSPITE